MAHSLTPAIRDQIVALLTDQVSLTEFQDWLVGSTRDIEQHGQPTWPTAAIPPLPS